MRLKVFAIVVGFLLLPLAGAHGDVRKTLESELRHSFEKKLLTLRTPFVNTVLKFDAQGNFSGNSETGPWTVNGVLEVKRLWLQDAVLDIEGNRVLIALNGKDSIFPVLSDRTVRVTITLATPLTTALDIEKAMARVFLRVDLLRQLNDYWKPSSALYVKIEPGQKRDPNTTAGTLSPDRSVFFANPGVTAPKPISTPDPEYSESARNARVQGTVMLLVILNEDGVPEVLQLMHSLEESLDARALLAVSKWKFQPSTKEGKPVAVAVNVEVSFKL